MIHLSALRNIIDPQDPNIKRPEFDVEVYKLNGDLVTGRVTCTSTNWKNNTINLKFVKSGEIRKFHSILITKYNGKEVIP